MIAGHVTPHGWELKCHCSSEEPYTNMPRQVSHLQTRTEQCSHTTLPLCNFRREDLENTKHAEVIPAISECGHERRSRKAARPEARSVDITCWTGLAGPAGHWTAHRPGPARRVSRGNRSPPPPLPPPPPPAPRATARRPKTGHTLSLSRRLWSSPAGVALSEARSEDCRLGRRAGTGL